jgi:hypothetical protein
MLATSVVTIVIGQLHLLGNSLVERYLPTVVGQARGECCFRKIYPTKIAVIATMTGSKTSSAARRFLNQRFSPDSDRSIRIPLTSYECDSTQNTRSLIQTW